MYMDSKAMRESMLPHQGGWSISEAILTAGQATADNLPAGLAEIQYMIRVPTLAMAEQVTAVLDRNADRRRDERLPVRAPLGVEVAAGLANHAMAGIAYEALSTVGAPQWDEAAKASPARCRSMPAASSRWRARSSTR